MGDDALQRYLKRVDRMGEPALVYSATLDVDAALLALETCFPGRPLFLLRATGPLESTVEEVFETFRNSFEGRGVLGIVVNAHVPAPLLRAVERICTDNHLTLHGEGGWKPLKPPPDWRMVVLARVADAAALEGGMASWFSSTLAL